MKNLVIAFALMTSSAGVAAESVKTSSDDLDQIVAHQIELKEQLVAGAGMFRTMPARQREELIARQERLLRLIGDRSTVSELSDSERLHAFNELEWIASAVSGGEDDRIVCRREQTTGSHRLQSNCRSVRQMREEREAAREQLSRQTSRLLEVN